MSNKFCGANLRILRYRGEWLLDVHKQNTYDYFLQMRPATQSSIPALLSLLATQLRRPTNPC